MDPRIVKFAQHMAKKYPKDQELQTLVQEMGDASVPQASSPPVRGYGPPVFKVEYDDGKVKEIVGWREMAIFLGITESSLRVRMSNSKYCLLRNYHDELRRYRRMRITRPGHVAEDHPDLAVDLAGPMGKPGPKKIDYDKLDDRIYGSAGPDIFVPRSSRVQRSPEPTPAKPRGRR